MSDDFGGFDGGYGGLDEIPFAWIVRLVAVMVVGGLLWLGVHTITNPNRGSTTPTTTQVRR